MPQTNEIVVPASSSGLGLGISSIVLNSVRGQAVLIDALLGNALAIALISIGSFALAFGIGQYLYQKKATKKWGALASFGSSNVLQGVVPFVVGSWMLNNLQTLDLSSITSRYVIYMGIVGSIFLAIGAIIIYKKVK
jgi:hypothetical protein